MSLHDTASLARKLRDHLGERFVVVARPEHPYLISPPDLLIGGEGLLTAAFVPNAAEKRIPHLLRARLVAARLALPEQTRCALVATAEFLHSIASRADALLSQRDFEIVLSVDDLRELAEFSNSDSVRMQREKELVTEKLHNAERSGRALILSEIAQRFDSVQRHGQSGKHKTEPSLSHEIEFVLSEISLESAQLLSRISHDRVLYPKTKRLRQFYRGEQLLMLARMDRRGDALSLAVQATFYSQYVLDMGVPYPRLDGMPIVFPDRQAEVGPKREFLTRAASLAGLIIGPAGAPQQVEKFIALEETARRRRLRRAELADWLRA